VIILFVLAWFSLFLFIGGNIGNFILRVLAAFAASGSRSYVAPHSVRKLGQSPRRLGQDGDVEVPTASQRIANESHLHLTSPNSV
jgi:hypothetical protein